MDLGAHLQLVGQLLHIYQPSQLLSQDQLYAQKIVLEGFRAAEARD